MPRLISKKRPQELQKQVEQKDVYANLELDVFAQQFDGNDFSGFFQLGFVDLADGGAGDGLFVERGENLWVGEGTVESTLAILSTHRRHFVVQLT